MDESSKEKLHREEEHAEFGSADVNGDYPNESVEEVNEPSKSTSEVGGVVV